MNNIDSMIERNVTLIEYIKNYIRITYLVDQDTKETGYIICNFELAE